MSREINLIGGFYKDNSLSFSAQDTVNWLPVPAQAGGTRSEMKLRGAPGLRALVRNASDLIGPAVWIYGPVNSEGGVSGNLHFYYSSDTAQSLTSSAPVSIPAAMAAISNNPVSRISVANNVIFLHGRRGPTVNAYASRNGGIDWIECDYPLSELATQSNDVFWNGRFYFWGKRRSVDGVTWTNTPNFPFAGDPISWLARDSDGAFLICAGDSKDVFVTLDDGATWATRINPYGVVIGTSGITSAMSTNGTTVIASSANGIGFGWSDDLFSSPATAVNGPGGFQKFNAGVWLGARSGGVETGLRRSLDGKTWVTVDASLPAPPARNIPTIATDGATWAFIKPLGGGNFRLRLSADGAQTWGDGAMLPAEGSIVYRGLP